MKHKLFHSPGDLEKAIRQYEPFDVESGEGIYDVTGTITRAARDDVAKMPEYAHCETAALAPEL